MPYYIASHPGSEIHAMLAGQSNMQGHVAVSTFDSLADERTTAPLLKEMRGKRMFWGHSIVINSTNGADLSGGYADIFG